MSEPRQVVGVGPHDRWIKVHIIDRGTGVPLVFVPGLQGRWEYMRRVIDALAGVCRVITFSLCDEPTAGYPFDQHRGLDAFADQIGAALDERGVSRAAICGLSLGGLIALRFAVRHPERTSCLVLVSTPGPGWHLRPAHEMYVRAPWLFAPLFFAGMPFRLRAEFAAALPRRQDRMRFQWEQVRTFLTAPLPPHRLAARARIAAAAVGSDDSSAVSVPTLIVTGEPSLDRVVPVAGTREYARLIPGARLVQLDRSGHLGCLTRPREFAAIVRAFLEESHHAAA
mgnify:FL=1